MPETRSYGVESSDEEGSDTSSKLGRPSLPEGVLRKRGAIWDGEEMELEHYREDRLSGEKRRKQDTAVAVDLTQFQNTAVGQGYQAKHVIRQRTVEEEPKRSITKISTKGENSTLIRNEAKAHSTSTAASELTGLNQLLQLKAIRDFRRELEKIK
jgi:predicted ATPase